MVGGETKTYCIADIKVDHEGLLIFADLDKIYQMDINSLHIRVLAQSYTACTTSG